MKKRLISMLLTVLMVASLFSGLSLNAYAADTFEYTMTDGDTVLAVCNAYGLNYYTCKNAIMVLNGFTSEQNFRYIPVGKVIKLPASNAVAQNISANGVTTSTTTQTGSTTTTVSTTTNSNGDTIAYWLIPYTLQRGETVYSVCNALGIPYGTYAKQIQDINNIKSLSWVKAGQTLLFPSVKTPAVGVSCYEVRAHKVTAGETAYSMCNNNGVSYNGNIRLLQSLNNKDNLNYVATGSTFYMPVSTVITAGTGASGSPVGGTTSTAAPTATPGATATPAAKVTYALKAVGSTGGTVGFSVDGKTVTVASAGDVVTVVAVPDSGKAVKSLDVVFSDGSAVPVLSGGDTFVMPACAVTATVEFKGGYLITVDSNYSTQVKLLVDGVSSRSASAGSLVQVVSEDPGLSVDDDGITVTKSTGGDVKVGTDNTFKMPSCDVTVKVNLESVKTYNFYKSCIASQGSFVLQSNGTTISKAAKGAEVTVLASPSIGYYVDQINVLLRGTTTKVTVKNGVFTMPDQDVDVNVVFAPDSSAIELAGTVNGTVLVSAKKDTLERVTTGLTGQPYYIFVKADTGYTAQKPTVKSIYDQTMINVDAETPDVTVPVTQKPYDGTYKVFSFTMPGKGALVTASFAGAEYSVIAQALKLGSDPLVAAAGCTVRVNNQAPTMTEGGVTLGEDATANVSTSLPDGYVLSRYEVSVYDGTNYVPDQELTNGANTKGTFLMPNAKIKVVAYVEAQSVPVYSKNLENCTVKFVKSLADTATEVSSYKVDDTAVLIVNPKAGYTVAASQVRVTGAVSGSAIALTTINVTATELKFSFVIPAEGVDVNVDVAKTSYVVKLSSAASDADLAGKLVVKIGPYGVPTVLTTGDLVKAAVGEGVYIDLTDELKAQGYTLTKIITTTASTGRIDYEWKNTWSFPMPAEEVIVSAVIKAPATVAIKYDSSLCNITSHLASDPITIVGSFKEGDEVLIKITANNGYFLKNVGGDKLVSISGVDSAKLHSLTVSADGKTAEIKFEMPYGEVLVTAKAERHARTISYYLGTEKDIMVVTTEGVATVLGDAGKSAHVGQTVYISLTAEAAKSMTITGIKVLNDDGSEATDVKVTWNGSMASFEMPDKPLKVQTKP